MSAQQQSLEQKCIYAIESNELEKMKQYLSSGNIHVNSILTSRHKIWDSNCMTVLAIASYSGSLSIVEFLVKKRVGINQTDKLKHRTA